MNVDPTTLQGNWHYPTEVRFGPGRIGELADACRELGMARPLLVTDPGLSRFQMVADVLSANEAGGLPTTVFSGIRANPVAANISDGVDSYRAGACDGVIAFGGGSALDAGKAVALMVGQSRPIQDFEDREDWSERVHAPGMAPVVAVPTTAGTGSEVGRASVIGDPETRTKKIIFHPNMLPERVICDPELTLGLPAHLTAATGMDALAHCLEAFCAPGFHPMADGIALEGMRLIHRWLPKAVADGTNLTGRAHMMAAAAMGATAFQKGLGAVHALSHPIGAVFDTHHGLTNAVLMPYVLNFNRPAIEDRMVRLGRYLGLAQASYDTVRDWILRLRDEIGIPNTLAEIGVASDRVEEIAELALADPSVAGNPLQLDEDGFRRLLREAMEG